MTEHSLPAEYLVRCRESGMSTMRAMQATREQFGISIEDVKRAYLELEETDPIGGMSLQSVMPAELGVAAVSERSNGPATVSLSFGSVAIWGETLKRINKYGAVLVDICLLYTSPSPRDQRGSRMPSSA